MRRIIKKYLSQLLRYDKINEYWQWQIQQKTDEAYKKGTSEGYQNGVAEGYAKGMTEGLEKSLSEEAIKQRLKLIYELLKSDSLNLNKLDDNIASSNEKQVLHLYNIHKNSRCFIIGNGPSVRLEDLEALQNEITFCCNKFYLAYPTIKFRPTYTVAADDQVLQDFGKEIIERSESTVLISTHDGIKLGDGKYIKFNRIEKSDPEFSYNILSALPSMGSVVICALQCAYFMGFQEVYLYGIDHNFKVILNPDEANVWRQAVNEGNHFIPNYRQGSSWAPPWIELMEKGFHLCKDVFEKDGRRIVNSTRGGKLDIFDRMDFDLIQMNLKN